MKIAIIGASGYAGRPITTEALDRGYEVTAIVRNLTALPSHPCLRARSVDVNDVPHLTEALGGNAAVIHAYNPGRGRTDPDIFDIFVAGHRAILAAVGKAGIQRLLCVGGAASLKTTDGVPLLDSPEWPKEFDPYRNSVRGTRGLYYLLQETP